MSKTGQFSPGKTEIPFEIPLRTKGGKELYETYHGVFINIQVILYFDGLLNFILKNNYCMWISTFSLCFSIH